MAWNSNHEFLELELHSSIVVNLVCACKDPMAIDWSASLDHVYREQNWVVDGLANLNPGRHFDCKSFAPCAEAGYLVLSKPRAGLSWGFSSGLVTERKEQNVGR